MRGNRQFAGSQSVLRRLGFEPEVISESDIAELDADLLVLPDVRRMSAETVGSIIKFAESGGKVLATYQTSFRDESGRGLKDFALGDLFGIKFSYWSDQNGNLLFIDKRGVSKSLTLGDSQAMMFKANGEPLVFWEDGTPFAVMNGNCCYAGADLFLSDNSDSIWTCRLIASLIESLFDDGIALREPEAAVSSCCDLRPVPVKAENFPLRIYLGNHSGEIIISSPSGVCAEFSNSHLLDPKAIGQSQELLPSFVRITPVASLEGMKASAYIGDQIEIAEELVFSSPGGWLELRKVNSCGTYLSRAYRGKFRIRAGAGLEIANIVDLEEYLAGNVPSEVPEWFEPEAIKAMSCVARTYALAHLGVHEDKGCDICDNVHCQVYNGIADESAETTALIAETKGMVLIQDGRPATCLYHAVCGGSTDDASSVWSNSPGNASGSIPADAFHFKSKPLDICDFSLYANDYQPANSSARTEVFSAFIENPPPCFCGNASRFRWEKVFSADELSLLLKSSLPVLLKCDSSDVGKLIDIYISKRTSGGRVAEMVIRTDKKTFRLGGDKVRWITSGGKIGSAGLNSSLFTVKVNKGTVRFHGGGWGHGIGLCQEGAQGRAKAGSSFTGILEAYYPLCRLGGIRQLKHNKV
ncbi:MAG: SpoIID/LytB domain-containing protein [bacterium]|nr:SpoIID/LytB domain-containing protein [bacterium]